MIGQSMCISGEMQGQNFILRLRLSPRRKNKSEEEEQIKCQYCGKNLETYVWLLKSYQIELCQKCTQKLSPLVFIENSKEMDEFIKHDKVRNHK